VPSPLPGGVNSATSVEPGPNFVRIVMLVPSGTSMISHCVRFQVHVAVAFEMGIVAV